MAARVMAALRAAGANVQFLAGSSIESRIAMLSNLVQEVGAHNPKFAVSVYRHHLCIERPVLCQMNLARELLPNNKRRAAARLDDTVAIVPGDWELGTTLDPEAPDRSAVLVVLSMGEDMRCTIDLLAKIGLPAVNLLQLVLDAARATVGIIGANIGPVRHPATGEYFESQVRAYRALFPEHQPAEGNNSDVFFVDFDRTAGADATAPPPPLPQPQCTAAIAAAVVPLPGGRRRLLPGFYTLPEGFVPRGAQWDKASACFNGHARVMRFTGRPGGPGGFVWLRRIR